MGMENTNPAMTGESHRKNTGSTAQATAAQVKPSSVPNPW